MLSQRLQLKLQQKLSPQQIQLMKLLQVPTIGIEQRIKEELEANPALDEGAEIDQDSDGDEYDDVYDEVSEAEQEFDFEDYMDPDDMPDYKLYSNNHSADDEERSTPLSGGATFHEVLERQLALRILSEEEKVIAAHIIGNIDDSGYLRREIIDMVDDLAFTQNVMTSVEELEHLLSVIQDFDPPGVAARDLQECLLLQLDRKDRIDEEVVNAKRIVEYCFDAFTKKHYKKIISKLDLAEEELKEAIEVILTLNPKPGNSMSASAKTADHIVPDFTIRLDQEDQIELTINGRNAPELRVSNQYQEMFKAYSANKKGASREQKDALLFVKQKLDSAKWFIDAIKQRQHTLYDVMTAILDYQHDYFVSGDETKLRPMILKDIADRVHLDISTVSRVVNSKYVQTPFGTFLLKSFFSESLSTDSGEEVSTREVKKILQDLIDGEDKRKPLTDEKLASLLKEKGYNIARRTVAKYREQLNLPVARLRKEL